MCKECGCEETFHEDECSCGCGRHYHGHRHFRVRHFLTKEEKIKRLKDYAEELKKELVAVEERIRELKGQ